MRRSVRAILVTIVALSFAFVVVRLAPGDPALGLLGPYATPEKLRILRQEMHLDQPLHAQFLLYLSDILHGDMGTSLSTRRPVSIEILSALPYTLELASLSILVSGLLGILLGTICAIKQNSGFDYFFSTISLFGISTPLFYTCLLFILFFSCYLGIFPATGAGLTPVERIGHLILPSLVLGISFAGMSTRMTRSCVLDELGKDYLRTIVAKGGGRNTVLKHALRNAFIPILTIIGMQFGRALGGACIIEVIFARPGMGNLLVGAIMSRDYPLVQGVIAIFALLLCTVNLCVDILYELVNPRTRTE